MPQIELKEPQIIHSENVIRMFMRIKHAVYQTDILPDQLLSQVRPGIDQQIPLLQAQDDRTACAIVFRVRATTDIAPASNHGYTNARPGSQDDQLAANIGCDCFFGQ